MDEFEPEKILGYILEEFLSAQLKFRPFNSLHEGYAVIQEELDELWDAVKKDDRGQAIEEAVQVGAMALRFIHDFVVHAAPEKGASDET